MSASKLLESASKLLVSECKVTSELYHTPELAQQCLPQPGKKDTASFSLAGHVGAK